MSKIVIKWGIVGESWSRSLELPMEARGYTSDLAEDFDRAVELFRLRQLRYKVSEHVDAEDLEKGPEGG